MNTSFGRFCPNHLFPAVANPPKPNHPMGSPNKCMDVRGAIFANGTPVQVSATYMFWSLLFIILTICLLAATTVMEHPLRSG